MNSTAITLEKILIEGKVFKSGATWKILETFFEKTREKILGDLSTVASQNEIDCIAEQIEANEYYDANVRIVDPTYLNDKGNIPSLFALNSKLCSVDGAENGEAAKELMGLKYLLIYSSDKNTLATKRFENDPNLSETERKLLTACDYFKSRDKKVILISPNESIIKRAEEEGFIATKLEKII